MSDKKMLEMKDISKRFAGVHALQNVDFSVDSGEIHALIGENGAGKSTLMKILSGALSCDEGQVYIDGKLCNIQSPLDAQKHGIGIIYQEFQLIPSLSVAENIYMGNFPYKVGKIIDWNKLRADAREALSRIGFDIDVTKQVGELSVAYQQMIEITKALTREVRLLVLDEPTSVLAPDEVKMLFKVMLSLKKQGVTMIYISHKLDELFEICDSITVMKDGTYVGTDKTANLNKDKLIHMMIGRNLATLFPKRTNEAGNMLLEANNIVSKVLKDCSINVRCGEIVGLSGLVGSGRTELVRAIFGADPISSGEIIIDCQLVKIDSPLKAVKNGIGLIPEDRKKHGVILSKSIRQNITMAATEKVVKMGVIKHNVEKNSTHDIIKTLRIKATNDLTNVGNLSGGNQQKVVLAKWMFCDCDILIFDEPTRGVDVGAKSEIYQLISDFAESGKGVIVISSEMEEIIGLCDRVYVMHEGCITGMVEKDDITEDSLMRCAIK